MNQGVGSIRPRCEIKNFISSQKMIQSKHAWFISTWSLNLSHDWCIKNSSHRHVGSIQYTKLLKFLPFSISKFIFLHLFCRMKFYILIKGCLMST
jgi:hypothetical protein